MSHYRSALQCSFAAFLVLFTSGGEFDGEEGAGV
jgi:hypothetical protein